MAHLAIQGHATRGNEVIALLEMLGGKNIPYGNLGGNNPNEVYYINKEGYINWSKQASGKATFTLEDFLVRFPYKVGDKVNSPCRGCVKTITSMGWDDYLNTITYKLNDREYTHIDRLKVVNDLPLVEQKPMEEKKINQMSLANCDLDEIEIVLGDKFELKIKDGKYYAVRKKPQYPTDYIDACSVLGISVTSQCEMDVEVYGDELYALYQLLVCRNAYWKIAGDWKPDWTKADERKYCIVNTEGNITKWVQKTTNKILVFPTAEIRDAFYENFKDLIKQCKELL